MLGLTSRRRAPVRLARPPHRHPCGVGSRPSVWRRRLGWLAVIVLNVACAGYVSSMFFGHPHPPWLGFGLRAPGASVPAGDLRLHDVGEDGAVVVRDVPVSVTAHQEENILLDNVDRALGKGDGATIVVKSPTREKSPPPLPPPPRRHSLVPPTKPVPLIRGMTEQVKLQQFGAAAVRNERLAARARHEHPLVPAKPCASRQKCHSVVYTVREDELAAVAASMNSVLHRSKEPERVCFHLIVPVGMDTGKLCRVTMAHAADNPDRFCPLKNGVLSQTEHFCPQAELLPIKGVAFNTTRGEHWVGECFCGTSQVHIVHFDPSVYETFALVAPPGALPDSREALDFAVTVLDDLLLPQLEGSGRVLLLPSASIVQVDVKALLEVRVADEVIAAPAKACDQTNDAWYNFDSVVVRASHCSLRTPYVEVNRTLNPEDCVMNTHVLMLDLPKYQTYSIPQRITTLIVRHRVRTMWHHGSALAPFILALQGHIQRVEGLWDVKRLGIDPDISQKQLDEAYVLHWTGPRLPWQPNGLYKPRWSKYHVAVPKLTLPPPPPPSPPPLPSPPPSPPPTVNKQSRCAPPPPSSLWKRMFLGRWGGAAATDYC